MSLNNIKKALSIEHISDFRRFRLTSSSEGEYCSFFDYQNNSNDKIIFDIESIKQFRSSNTIKVDDQSEISLLYFQRQFPDHKDFFLFDIKHHYFTELTSKQRSSLINRLIRCIDVTYVIMLSAIKVKSTYHSLNENNMLAAKSVLDWAELTETEFTYLQLLSTIGTSKEIGHIFDKSSRTIEKMTSNLCKKLKIYNKLELQLFAKFLTSYIDIPYEYIRYPLIDSKAVENNYRIENENKP